MRGCGEFFLFGLAVEQVTNVKQQGYNSRVIDDSTAELRDVIDRVARGDFSSLLTTNSTWPRVQFGPWASSTIPSANSSPGCTSTCGLRCRFREVASPLVCGIHICKQTS